MGKAYWGESRTGAWITHPTISDMRALLDEFEALGWSPEQNIQMKPIANALGSFSVEVVDAKATV